MNPSDMTLLLTRPEAASRRFQKEAETALGAFGAVIISPAMQIVPVAPFPEIPDDVELAFTSENAVRVAAQHIEAAGRPAWCVGARTAKAAGSAGFTPRSANGTAADLAQMVQGARPAAPILHLSGRHQAGGLVERLTDNALAATRVAIYDQDALPLGEDALEALSGERSVLVPLFSPRSAAIVSKAAVQHGVTAPLYVVAISEAAAKSWVAPSTAQRVAERPNAPAVVAAMGYLIHAISDA